MKFALRAIPFILMQAVLDESQSTAGGEPQATQQPSGEVPSTNDPAAATEAPRKRAPKNPDNILNIINGRIPLPLAFLIRFKEGRSTSDIAKAYGTSVGKVFDLKKMKNFGYITADYKASEEEMTAARRWLTDAKTAKGQTLREAGGDPDGIAKLLDTVPTATQEEVAKRNWNVRVVGQASGQAPTAPTAPADGQPAVQTAAEQLEKPQGAKLF